MMPQPSRTIILYDYDPLYAERFLRSLNSRAGIPFRAVAAQSPEEVISRIKESAEGILLLAEELLPSLPEEAPAEGWRICLLCEGNPRESDPYPGIRRYQPISGILTELTALAEPLSCLRRGGHSEAWILGIFSPASTSLTGAVAWLCARILSARRSVLYMPLDYFLSFGVTDGPREQGLSDLLFRRSHSPGDFRLPELTVQREGLTYLPPAVNPEDLWQLSAHELGHLPEEILPQSGAEVMVVSFPCGKDPRPFFSVCRHILLPAENTPDSRQALQSFREYLTLQEQDALLFRSRELLLPHCPELSCLSASDPLLRHTPLGRLVEEELQQILSE